MGADAYLEKNTDIKDVGICGDEKYRRDEWRYLAHKDGGKRRHLTRKETLFPKDMLEQMCNKCGKWVDDYAMKDQDIEMLCDACPGWADGHEYCDKFRRARTSAPTTNQRRRHLMPWRHAIVIRPNSLKLRSPVKSSIKQTRTAVAFTMCVWLCQRKKKM